MSMLDSLPPRAWTELSVPAAPSNAKWFDFYTEWLADHLFRIPVRVHPRQRDYVTKMEACEPTDCIFEISDLFGYTIDDMEGIERWFADGETWAAFNAWQREVWVKDMSDEDREMESYEDWAHTEATWLRLFDEWTEAQALAPLPTHADIPFRALLAAAIKRIPDRATRIESIRHYFDNFTDNAAK